MALDRARIARDFAQAVNMTADALAEWLETERSHAVGWKGPRGDAAESVGHASGRRIVGILRAAPADLTDDDYAHMRKTVGYIRRHRAQPPENQVTSRWRYALMNWGCDPLIDDA